MTSTRGRKPKLTLNAIYQASLELMEGGGLEALSMRSLAKHMGVGAMTLYGYVDNKSELINGTIDYMLQDLKSTVNIEKNRDQQYYRGQLTELLLQLNKLSLSHTTIIELLVLSTYSSPTLNQFRDTLMSLLLKLGLSKKETVNAGTALSSYVVGFCMIRRARISDDNRLKLPELESAKYTSLKALEKQRRSSLMRDDSFLYGLNKLLDSILT